MLVETYETMELDSAGIPECEPEALELIESLGLDGQRSLVTDDGETQVRQPYAKVTKEQKRVIQMVCPKETEVSKYKDGLIPLRVLQVAFHAKELFDKVVVWHPENADEKDPYLIGVNNPQSYTYEYFLLARWGDELLPWEVMKKKACDKIRQLRKGCLKELLGEVQQKLGVIDELPDEKVLTLKEDLSLSDWSV